MAFSKGNIPWNVGKRYKSPKSSATKKGMVSPMKGKKHTEESKEKNRLAHLGKKLSEETKRKMSLSTKGIPTGPFSEERRSKLSAQRKGRPAPGNRRDRPEISGERNNRWNGGNNIDALKKKCLIRDDFTCQRCGMRDVDIAEVDHIKERYKFPELYLDLSNLQTLCPNCHRRKTYNMHENRGSRYAWKERYKLKNPTTNVINK